MLNPLAWDSGKQFKIISAVKPSLKPSIILVLWRLPRQVKKRIQRKKQVCQEVCSRSPTATALQVFQPAHYNTVAHCKENILIPSETRNHYKNE